jgi:selenide,water dikinase
VLPVVALLNGPAMDTALEFDVHACTDVTGFGLAGHLQELAVGSNVGIRLYFSNLQFYPNAHAMYRRGEKTGSNASNRQLVGNRLSIRTQISTLEEELLYDPQTSGGLLLAVPEPQAEPLLNALAESGNHTAFLAGHATDGAPGIEVV